MDFRFTAEQETFRQDIRAFVREAMPEAPDIPEDAWIIGFDRTFSKKLAARGWIGLPWPREYGGQGKSYLDRLILTEELLRHGAPVAAHWLGDRQMGIHMKLSINSRRKFNGFMLLAQAFPQYLCGGLSFA